MVDVVYDMCFYDGVEASGITRVFDELIARVGSHGVRPALLARRNGRRFDQFDAVKLMLPPQRAWRPWRVFGAMEQRRQRRARVELLKRCEGAVFHSTFFTDSSPVDLPEVVTVHDMIPELFPEFFDDAWAVRYVADKARCVERARRIVCVSETTKRDLCRIANVSEERVRVIPNAVGQAFLDAAKRPGAALPMRLPAKGYFLYVGSRAHYKGFWTLVRAVMKLPRSLRLPVICVGDGPFRGHERHGLAVLEAGDWVRPAGWVSDEELVSLYREARAVVVPSYYEGFGLVALEALAVGATLICSDTPALHETAGEYADYYFDPSRVDELVDCLAQASERRDERERIRPEKVNGYTWDDAAALLAGVYREVLDG